MTFHEARTTLHAIELGFLMILLPIVTIILVAAIQRFIYSRRF